MDLEFQTTNFISLEQGNQMVNGDLQLMDVEKSQEHKGLAHRVWQLQVAFVVVSLGAQTSLKELTISIIASFCIKALNTKFSMHWSWIDK